MILAALCFSIMGAMVKAACATIPPLETSFFRGAVSLALLMPFMILSGVSFIGKQHKLLFLRGLAGCGALTLTIYVTSKIRLADASALNHTSIIFVTLLSAWVLKEHVSKRLWYLVVLGLVGACFVIKPGLGVMSRAGMLGLLGGLCSGVAYISIRRLHETESSLTIVFYFLTITTLVNAILSYSNFVMPNSRELIFLFGVGFFGLIGQVFMTQAYKFERASVVNPYSFAGVLFSALWGALFWSELPDLASGIGAAMIIVAGILIFKEKKGEKVMVEGD